MVNDLKNRKAKLRIRIENAILGILHISSHLPFNLSKLNIKIKSLKKLIDKVNGCQNEVLIISYENSLNEIELQLNDLISKDNFFIDSYRYERLVEFAGVYLKRSRGVKRPQLQLIYFFLFHLQDKLFIDILRFIEKYHLDGLVQKNQTTIYNEKKDEFVRLKISPELGNELNIFLIKNNILKTVFQGSDQKRLGQSKTECDIIYNSDNFYRFINHDIKVICEKENFPKLSCYSFQFPKGPPLSSLTNQRFPEGKGPLSLKNS